MIALALLLAASAYGAAKLQRDWNRWEPDAAIYLRMTLQDRGLDREQARAEANRFMRSTSEGASAADAAFYGPHPPAYYASQFDLFRTRPLYPGLGAAVYPRLGPHGLQIVSAAAYALAVPLLYCVLLLVAPVGVAALGAVGFALLPPVRELSTYALTDELACLFWIATLGAMLAYVRFRRPVALAAVVGTAALLAFTRPALYLPLGAALGVLLAVRREPGARSDALRLLAAAAVPAVAFLAYSALVHGPGLREQLRWQYAWQVAIGATSAGPGAWYAHALARTVLGPLVHNVVRNGALAVLALTLAGAWLAPRSRVTALLLGAAAATVVAVLVNPLELVRTVVVPLAPVAVALAASGAARWLERRGRNEAAPLTAGRA